MGEIRETVTALAEGRLSATRVEAPYISVFIRARGMYDTSQGSGVDLWLVSSSPSSLFVSIRVSVAKWLLHHRLSLAISKLSFRSGIFSRLSTSVAVQIHWHILHLYRQAQYSDSTASSPVTRYQQHHVAS